MKMKAKRKQPKQQQESHEAQFFKPCAHRTYDFYFVTS